MAVAGMSQSRQNRLASTIHRAGLIGFSATIVVGLFINMSDGRIVWLAVLVPSVATLCIGQILNSTEESSMRLLLATVCLLVATVWIAATAKSALVDLVTFVNAACVIAMLLTFSETYRTSEPFEAFTYR